MVDEVVVKVVVAVVVVDVVVVVNEKTEQSNVLFMVLTAFINNNVKKNCFSLWIL
jgi:hypothetical protein